MHYALCDQAPPQQTLCDQRAMEEPGNEEGASHSITTLSFLLPKLQQYLYWSGSNKFGVSDSSVREPRPCTHATLEQTHKEVNKVTKLTRGDEQGH